MAISAYSDIHTGPNQLLGGVQSGFASEAYQRRATTEATGENAEPISPAPHAARMKAPKTSQFGREFRPR